MSESGVNGGTGFAADGVGLRRGINEGNGTTVRPESVDDVRDLNMIGMRYTH